MMEKGGENGYYYGYISIPFVSLTLLLYTGFKPELEILWFVNFTKLQSEK